MALQFVPKGSVNNKWTLVQVMARRGTGEKPLSEPTRTTRPPALLPHDYPYYWVILDPKSKEDKVKVTNLKNLPNIFDFWIKFYTRHTFWSCLIRCANMKWIRPVLLKIQSRHDSVHRRTDGWAYRRTTDKVKPVCPPFNFVEAGGIMMIQFSNEYMWNEG